MCVILGSECCVGALLTQIASVDASGRTIHLGWHEIHTTIDGRLHEDLCTVLQVSYIYLDKIQDRNNLVLSDFSPQSAMRPRNQNVLRRTAISIDTESLLRVEVQQYPQNQLMLLRVEVLAKTSDPGTASRGGIAPVFFFPAYLVVMCGLVRLFWFEREDIITNTSTNKNDRLFFVRCSS